jgi:Domain of unknown function (DUF4337)
VEALREKYLKEAERYGSDKDEIREKAGEFEKEPDLYGRCADRFDAGEGLLEIGLVICSLTLLTHKREFWLGGSLIAAGGIGVALSAFLLHLDFCRGGGSRAGRRASRAKTNHFLRKLFQAVDQLRMPRFVRTGLLAYERDGSSGLQDTLLHVRQ